MRLNSTRNELQDESLTGTRKFPRKFIRSTGLDYVMLHISLFMETRRDESCQSGRFKSIAYPSLHRWTYSSSSVLQTGGSRFHPEIFHIKISGTLNVFPSRIRLWSLTVSVKSLFESVQFEFGLALDWLDHEWHLDISRRIFEEVVVCLRLKW